MSMTKREKTLLFVVLLLAVVAAYYMLVLKPYIDESGELSTEKTEKQALVDKTELQEKAIAEFDLKIADLEEQLKNYSVDISTGFDQPPVLVYLEDTVNASAQKVMFSFQEPREVGQVEVCAVTVNMVSTYSGLKDILNTFSNDAYFITITGLSAAYANMQESSEQDGDVYDSSDTEEPAAPVDNYDKLDIKLSLEFYNMAGDIPMDKEYTFDDDVTQYGGDIFF